MANSFFGGFTLVTTGIQTYSGVGFQGKSLEFYAGSKNGSSTTLDQQLIGSMDATGYCEAKTWFRDATGFKYIEYTDRCISIWDRVGGVMTEVLRATFSAWTTDGFKLNITTANVAYQVEVRVRD